MRQRDFPDNLYVYVADYDNDGEPIFSATRTVEEIPEDEQGSYVGCYTRGEIKTFDIKKELA